ncbi:MAG: TVP38/TMEM64 family protein [Rhodospirillales bacterium]
MPIKPKSSAKSAGKSPGKSSKPEPRGLWGVAKRWLPLAVLVVGTAAFFLSGAYHYVTFDTLREHREALLGWVKDMGVLAGVILILGYALVVAFSLPLGILMTLTAGFLFGTVLGTVYVVIAATLGSIAVFLAARTALGDFLRKRAAGFFKRMEAGFKRNEFSYLLFLRLVPVFPFWLVNIVPAFLGVSLRNYVLATFIGVIPGSAVFAAVGNGLGAVFDQGKTPDLSIIFKPDILLPILGLALLSLAPVAYNRYRDRKGKRA